MKKIKLYFENVVAFSNLNVELFSSKLNRPKTFNLNIEKSENYLTLIKNGIINKYFPCESTDKPIELVFAGNFESAYDFYLTKQKTTFIIETITPSEVLCISHADFQSHYNLTTNGNHVDRFASEENFIKKSKLEIALISLVP